MRENTIGSTKAVASLRHLNRTDTGTMVAVLVPAEAHNPAETPPEWSGQAEGQRTL
jgi:hypothetical protein